MIEKLEKLLLKAVDNGFDLSQLPTHFSEWLYQPNSAHLKSNGRYNVKLINDTLLILGELSYSLNDLVLNTDFFDRLFGAANPIPSWISVEVYQNYTTTQETIGWDDLSQFKKAQWSTIKDPEQRLYWLIKQFEI